MIGLMFALLASPAVVETQAIQATLQSCAEENGRYVCRYAVPDIMIVPIEGSNIVADAPSVVLGNGSSPEAPSPETLPPAPSSTVIGPAAPPVAPSAAPAVAPATTAAVDPGPIRPIDAGVLTERESQLVSRCADAGWVSLCLPDDRRAARTLRDRQEAYLAVRREVTRLLSDDDCDAAVKAALDGGYLGLARETRDYCRAPAAGAGLASAAARPAPVEAGEAVKAEERVED
ncbi:hypothetical protein [Brevundimonas sp.]|uniref:hypothetical protein n=1 Tax=Brevundimonas sp. TaxID=1871086 RepID=UPI003D150BC7